MNLYSKILAAFFVGLAIAGGGAFLYLALDDDKTQHATVWPAPRMLPTFALVDHNGGPVGPGFFRGHWSLVFFGFTHCPDICPATLQVLSAVQRQLRESMEIVPRVVLVSVDPERDSPETLAAYVGHFGEDISGITGELSELQKLTSAAGIFFEKTPLEGDGYTVDHSAVVLLVDENAAIHASFGAPHSVKNYVEDLPIIINP